MDEVFDAVKRCTIKPYVSLGAQWPVARCITAGCVIHKFMNSMHALARTVVPIPRATTMGAQCQDVLTKMCCIYEFHARTSRTVVPIL